MINNLQHIWTVICKNSSVDQATNNMSLFNIIEQADVVLEKDAFKQGTQVTIPLELQIVTLWKSRKETKVGAEQKVSLIDPNGEVINSTVVPKFEILKEKKRHRINIIMQGMNLTTTGDYIFEISLKEEGSKDFEKVAEIPLQVNISFK